MRVQKGQVYMCDGLVKHQVDIALDRHFDRIQSMMFICTWYPKEDGEYELADDGCSD